MEGLVGLSAVIRTHRTCDEVTLASLSNSIFPSSRDSLVETFAVASAIGDDLLAGLSGWALQETSLHRVAELEELIKFPALYGTEIHLEMQRRLLLHKWAASGIESIAGLQIPDAGLTTSWFDLHAFDDASASQLDRESEWAVDRPIPSPHNSRLVHLLPTERITPSHFESFPLSDKALADLTTGNVALCADILRSRRFGDSFEGYEVRSGRRLMGDALAEFLMKALLNGASIPIELRIEMLLLGDDVTADLLARPLLGDRRNAWALASAPPESVRLLLEISKQKSLFDWVVEAIDIMSARGHGPEFVRAVGMLTSFRLVLFAVENLPVNSYVSDGLTGMVAWALTQLTDEGRIDTLEACVALVAAMPKLLGAAVEGTNVSQRILTRFGIAHRSEMLSASTLRHLDEIDLHFARR
jgi:hypothetical protein